MSLEYLRPSPKQAIESFLGEAHSVPGGQEIPYLHRLEAQNLPSNRTPLSSQATAHCSSSSLSLRTHRALLCWFWTPGGSRVMYKQSELDDSLTRYASTPSQGQCACSHPCVRCSGRDWGQQERMGDIVLPHHQLLTPSSSNQRSPCPT